MDKVGIELQLKENLQERLGKILPLLTKMNSEFNTVNKTLAQMQTFQNNANRGFQQMASQMANVSRQSRGLQNVNNQVKNVGLAATGATGKVIGLGSALGGLAKTIAPLLGLYKMIQGIGFVGHEGLDFQKQVVSLQQLKIPESERQAAIAESLRLGQTGKYTMGGADFLSAYKEAVPVLPSASDARKALPEIGEMSMRLRRTGMEGDPARMLPRFWELYGMRTEAQRKKFDEALLKVEQFTGGKIDLGQLLMQSNVAGTAIIGQDPMAALTQLAFGIKESGAGAGGSGGGSRGRAGFGMQAIDRLLSLGQVTAGTVEAWHQLGWLPGIEQFAKHSQKGRKILTNVATGQPEGFMVTSGNMAGAGTGRVTVAQFKEYIAKHPPKFLETGATDQSLFAKQMMLGAAQIAGMKGTPEQMLKQFEALPDVQQKQFAAKVLPGFKSVGMQTLMQMATGRYKQSFARFQSGVSEQEGFNSSNQTAVQDKWEQMMAQFKTFADNLMNNANVVKSLTDGITILSDLIKALNDNVGPIAKYVSTLTPGTGTEAAGMLGGGVTGGAIGGIPGAVVGAAAGKSAGALSDAILGGVDKFRKTPAGRAVYDWGKKNLAPFTGHGTVLVPPPPPYVPSMVDNSLARQYAKLNGLPPPPPGVPVSNIKQGQPTVINQTFNIHPMAGIDGERIKKQVADAVAPHLQRQQLKNARKMSYAASEPGGSYTDKTHNSGSGQ